jgi:hypothetical protein
VVIHLLRYDDFSAQSSRAVEEQLAGMFLKHRIPCTFAVVPFFCAPESLVAAGEVKLTPLPASKADVLKPLLQAGLAEIALHGFAHLALAPVRGYQEFSQRMPRDTQRQLIRRGRSHLESVFGVKVRLFVPPWNRLGSSTAAVLQEEGLLLSSGGPEATDLPLGQLPCPNLISETSCALATARRSRPGQNCVGTVLHDYDFKESNLGVSELTLAAFETELTSWKSGGAVEHRLISDAISPDRELEGQKARANLTLRKVISSSRLRRKFGSKMFGVHWDAKQAERLARLLRFIP